MQDIRERAPLDEWRPEPRRHGVGHAQARQVGRMKDVGRLRGRHEWRSRPRQNAKGDAVGYVAPRMFVLRNTFGRYTLAFCRCWRLLIASIAVFHLYLRRGDVRSHPPGRRVLCPGARQPPLGAGAFCIWRLRAGFVAEAYFYKHRLAKGCRTYCPASPSCTAAGVSLRKATPLLLAVTGVVGLCRRAPKPVVD
jgi:hypothetical protein